MIDHLSQLSHYLQLLFCCILCIFVVTKDSVTLKFSLPRQCPGLLVRDFVGLLLKYSYCCFSFHFCFLVIVVLFVFMLSVVFLIVAISVCFLCSLWVVLLMHWRYLQRWRVLFLLLFLTHIVCLCHLSNVRPYASQVVFLSSRPFVWVLSLSISRMVPRSLQYS